MNRFCRSLAVATVGAMCFALPAGAATFTDDFSAYGTTTVLNAPDSLFGGNWLTTDGTVDFLAAGSSFGGLCRGDAACIDLDGSTSNAGVFATGALFDPGAYLLSYTLYGSSRGDTNIVDVLLGGFASQHSIASTDSVTVTNALVTLLAPSRLSFSNQGGDNLGALLTSVSVEPVVSAIPIPGALVLALSAFGLLAAFYRRPQQV